MEWNASSVEITLAELLERKELRMKQQQEWLRRHSYPLISFTVNMPGPVKLNQSSYLVMQAAFDAIELVCSEHNWQIMDFLQTIQNTGPEFLLVIKEVSVVTLKKAMVSIEENHPLGRLMDIDVLDQSGQIYSRQEYGKNSRRCLICGEDAKICARSRQHSLPLLIATIKEMVDAYGS